MEMSCDCADYIVSWWEENAEGRLVLHINDDRVPPVCPGALGHPFGADFAVIASAAVESGW